MSESESESESVECCTICDSEISATYECYSYQRYGCGFYVCSTCVQNAVNDYYKLRQV